MLDIMLQMVATPQEFIENAPLYTRIVLENFAPPPSITRMCTRPTCKKETTWFKTGNVLGCSLNGAVPEIDFKAVGYKCGLCLGDSFAVVYELLNWTEDPKSLTVPRRWHHTAVRKIGQVPPQEISISAELTGRLGATAGHYNKALVCREQSYGIAAMAYLRRVVDEKTDELIDVMAELSRGYNVGNEEVARLINVKSQVRYEDKLKVAAELVPAAVRPGGVNPLGQLYKHTRHC